MGVQVVHEVDGVDGVSLYTATDTSGAPIPGRRVALIGAMHGNEPVGPEVLSLLAAEVGARLRAGSILAVLANQAARAAGLRSTPGGPDMNRLWDPANLTRVAALPPEQRVYEEARALELAPLLRTADAILDLHSTSRPAPPFLLVRDDLEHRLLARELGVPRLITGVHEGGVLPGGLAVNVDLVAGQRGKRLGLLFEAGQHDAPGNALRAWAVTQRLLHALGLWDHRPPTEVAEPDLYEIVERFAQAPAGREPWRFATGTRRFRPPRRLESFEEIEADEILVRAGADRVARAEAPFTMLMPAPTAGPGEDLFFVAQRRHGGLGDVARTREEAVRTASAVERMLDLVEDDEFAFGTTWASFDGARILDRCAELVGRALRLPEGHPDRRISVVGRGDWGGGPAEQRRGRRYRQVMRRAIADGLAIDRYQLMRGASVGWIDALTSPENAARFAARARRDPVRMILSARQPHTVALLVSGDLDAAVAGGDARHVRVALVVEALSVSSHGDQIHTRMVRAALFSARPEILVAAHRLLGALRRDHEELVRGPDLAPGPGEEGLVDDAGAFRMDGSAEYLGRVRGALRRLQFRTWLNALRVHLPAPLRLDAGQLGPWLASVMETTGIGDVHTLRALLVDAEPGGWRVSLDRLEAAVEAPSAVPVPHPPRLAARPEPVLADEVDADTIERWAGARRLVRQMQPIPGHRGRDLELPLTKAAIRELVVGLYAHAREAARRAPGRVLVAIAGDGQSPLREAVASSAAHLCAHRDLVRDPNVRYLRIQHAEATHLGWMKDLLAQVDARGPGAAPVSLRWEHEHGGTVNVVLVATALEDADAPSADTLDGWHIEACGVLVSRLEAAAGEYAVALFTHALDGGGRANPDLLHFARAHCQGLLGAAPLEWVGSGAELEPVVLRNVARWVEEVRAGAGVERLERLGRIDARLRDALEAAAGGALPALSAARAVWAEVGPWPGVEWARIAAAK